MQQMPDQALSKGRIEHCEFSAMRKCGLNYQSKTPNKTQITNFVKHEYPKMLPKNQSQSSDMSNIQRAVTNL